LVVAKAIPDPALRSSLIVRPRYNKRPLSLRVFGCLPGTGARGCMAAGVQKASREETAGEFATAVVSIYGDLAPVLDLICRLQRGTRVE
jgi:hypothetical protein